MEYARLRDDSSFPLYVPNDYNLTDGSSNTVLDLINAKRAWNITHGSSSVYVGIYEDGYFDITHEDLVNQIYVPNNPEYAAGDFHATMVSGCVAADTNNGEGIAAIGFNTSLIGANGSGESVWDFYDDNPQINVINISQGWDCDPYPDHAAMFENLWNLGVVVVAGAGNAMQSVNQCPSSTFGIGNGYLYPASYEHVISVTSVGHKNARGSDIHKNWKDVHLNVPGLDVSGHTHNDKVDICAPGYSITSTNLNDSYAEGSGTSFASPIVAGTCALMFAVNPDITPAQVKNILQNTAVNIYALPENQGYGFEGWLGAGRLNAYGAVLGAHCLDELNPEVDLVIWDSDEDLGEEPNLETEEMWRSPEIWVRNQADRRETHQNPIHDPTSSYVYVRVTNTGCATSSGNDQLTVYWAKASTSLAWPQNWDGTFYMEDPVTGQDVRMGDEIATLTVPALSPGEETILEFEWHVPDPSDYNNINPDPWHFCLLARIESAEDPLTDPNEPNINEQVGKNNNVAWKNTTVVDIDPNSLIGGVIAVGNPFETVKTYDLEFTEENNEPGIPIYDEAEVAIEMDSILFAAWVKGGEMVHNLRKTRNDRIKIVTGDHARLKNIQFKPKEIGTLNLTFNFLTKEATDKTKYVYHVIQRHTSNDKILGGETYIVNNQKEREMFMAEAGNDQSIEDDESVTIQAAQINEPAVYNWYDPDGVLIYSGTNLTISPEMTQKYKLEIIADSDGYKDYDEVEITVNPYSLVNITPNPASNQVTIHYDALEANSAYLMITHSGTSVSNNYILNTQETQHTIAISTYASGIYVVSLVCDGEVVASGNLAIN